MQEVVAVLQSTKQNKALILGNSRDVEWANPIWTASVAPDPLVTDGVIPLGDGGSFASRQIMVLPYCEGNDGSDFYMRLWGWNFVGNALPNQALWSRVLLAELYCMACAASGLPGSVVGPSEFFCDTLRLTAGHLGVTGYLVSPADGPIVPVPLGPGGPVAYPLNDPPPPTADLIGYAVIDTRGCRFLQFQFRQNVYCPAFGNALFTML